MSVTSWRAWRRELCAWGALASMGALGLISQSIPQVVTLIIVGQEGVVPLASVSLAGILAYGACECIWVGMSLGQSALVAQAAGAGRPTAAYGWTALSAGMGLLASVLLLLPVFLAGHLAVAAVGDTDLDASIARAYLRASLPVPLIVALSNALRSHLTAVQRVIPVAVIDIMGAVVDIAATIKLVPAFGVAGAGYANVLSVSINLLLSGGAFFLWSAPTPEVGAANDDDSRGEDEEKGESNEDEKEEEEAALVGDLVEHLRQPEASSEADGLAPTATSDGVVTFAGVLSFTCSWRNIWTFTVQAGSATASLALEIAAEACVAFLAASLGGVSAAVSNSLNSLFETSVMIPYAAFEATSVRIGYLLGGKRIVAAKRVGFIAGAVLSAWVVLLSAVLLCARDVLGRIFSQDEAVVSGIAALLPAYVITYAAFSAYIALCSVLDGQGRAHLYPIVSLLAVTPVMLALAFASFYATQLGLNGLWGAMTGGYLAGVAGAGWLLWRSDWKELVALAQERSSEAGADG